MRVTAPPPNAPPTASGFSNAEGGSSSWQGEVVKKKVTVHGIDAHPTQCAIVISYVQEITTRNERGATQTHSKPGNKSISVRGLNSHVDLHALANEIISSSKLLHSSKQDVIVAILVHLHRRAMQEEEMGFEDDERAAMGQVSRFEEELMMEEQEGQRMALLQAQMLAAESALESLDSYLEMLYEESLDDKIKGTLLILQLARSSSNLEALVQHENVFSVLTRVLKDDGQKSLDLSLNIIYVFFCFSAFSEFHPFLSQNEVGAITIRLVDYEVKRYGVWLQDLEAKTQGLDRKKESDKDALEREQKNFKLKVKKQEKLLYVALHLLLNLAEDIGIEKKMRKKNIVKTLLLCLDRKNTELGLLSVMFLKKLAVFKENKDDMAAGGIVIKIVKYLESSAEVLVMATLRLMLNLSFDNAMRDDMVKAGVLPKLVDLLKREAFKPIVLKLLYHISTDDKTKAMFSYTDCVQMVTLMIQQSREEHVDRTLLALAINLASNARCAEVIAGIDGVASFMQRTIHTQDTLVCKVVRNMAQHDSSYKKQFVQFIPDLISLLRTTDDVSLLVEILGILGNLNGVDVPFAEHLVNYDLVPLLQRLLLPGVAEDDIVLEVVMFIGACAGDPNCAPILASSHLVQSLHDTLTEKQNDDEIVLQTIYTFFKFLHQPSTREILLKETKAIRHLCELSYFDHNEQISKLADQTVDIVLALEPDLADIVRETKFRVFNAEWLSAVENSDDHDQFEHEDADESAYHSYGSTWGGQQGLWSHGMKFVGDEEDD